MAQVQADDINGPPISECIEKYLVSREQELDERTLGQHRLALDGCNGSWKHRESSTSGR